jgi:predicted phage-related endonuclease
MTEAVEPTEDNTVDLDDLADRWERYCKAKDAISFAEKVAKETYADITARMAEAGAEFATIKGVLVSRYRPVDSERLDQKKLEENYPEAYKACLVRKTSMRLERVK